MIASGQDQGARRNPYHFLSIRKRKRRRKRRKKQKRRMKKVVTETT
jgi:hypothetical protein